VSIAVFTIRLADCQSATLSVLATAVPPRARISSTTRCAGPTSEPSPLALVPRSLTTTRREVAPDAVAGAGHDDHFSFEHRGVPGLFHAVLSWRVGGNIRE